MLDKLQRHWRQVLALLVTAGFLLAIVSRRAEVVAVLGIVRRTQPRWLVPAVLTQALAYLCLAVVYWRSLALLGYPTGILPLYRIAFVGILLSRVFPTSGTAFLLYQLHRRDIPDGTAAIVATLNLCSGLVAFLMLFLGGTAYLFAYGSLRAEQIWIEALILVIIAVLVLSIWALLRNRALFTRYALTLKQLLAQLLRRSWGDTRLLTFVDDLYNSLGLMRQHRWRFIALVGIQLAVLLFDCMTLLFLFLALDVRPHLSVVLLGYSLAYVVSAATSLPGGGGSFEAAMTLTFTQLGIATELALSATLLYRVLAFWLPLVVCVTTYRRIDFQRAIPPGRAGVSSH